MATYNDAKFLKEAIYSILKQTFTKFELMRAQLIVADSAAAVLHEILKHAKSRQSELDQVSNNITSMAKYMNDLSYTKRSKR